MLVASFMISPRKFLIHKYIVIPLPIKPNAKTNFTESINRELRRWKKDAK